MTKHAVFFVEDGDTFFLCENKIIEVFGPFSLADLCMKVLKFGISHLWVHSSVKMRVTKPAVEKLQSLNFDCLVQCADRDIVSSLHAYQKHGKGRSQRFNIIFLEYSSWDWQALLPQDVLDLVEDLEINLGVPVSGSPSSVGMRYWQKITEKRPQWLAKTEFDLSTLPWNQAARPLIWQRQPDRYLSEFERNYLIAYDKNAAYPRAAKEEKFGYGEPLHLEECKFCPDFPGMWRIECEDKPVEALIEHIAYIPSPLWAENEWYATPIVKLLTKMEIPFRVKEAWVFEKSAHIFRQWVDNLWDFRKERKGYERDAYKGIMNDTLGLLRSDKLGTNTFKFRPDRNMTVVAGARAAMFYNIMRYAQKGFYPIMVQLDALYYLTDESDPCLAVPGILDHPSSLGGYKVKFCIPTDEVEEGMTVRAILASLMPQSKKLRLLNKIAARLGYHG